jgi:6-phosphogluconolactonase (cycloisomerase 2 family)
MVSDPSGKHIYVVNAGDATISQYAVASGGALTPLSPATVALPQQQQNVAMSVEPGGRALYVVMWSSETTIAQFAIGGDGRLSPLNPAYISVMPALQGAGALVFDPRSSYAYMSAADATNQPEVLQLALGADGALSLDSTPALTLVAPATLAFSPDGSQAYTINECRTCSGSTDAVYTVGTAGQLTVAGTMTLGPTTGFSWPVGLLFSPSSATAYLLSNTSLGIVDPPGVMTGMIFPYAVAPNGMLDSPAAAVQLPFEGTRAQVFGPRLYVLGIMRQPPTQGSIAHYTIDSGGNLSADDSAVTVPGAPVALVLVAAE